MASVMAIISKAVFEKQHGELGQVLPIDRYASTHKALDGLAAGGAIFLVTVRPPDEVLWLVGIVEAPARDATGWVGKANVTPITDVSRLRGELRFATGAGIQAKPGALGMSLQTPRALTDADVALLRGVVGGRRGVKQASAARTAAPVPGAGAAAVTTAIAAGDPGGALVAALAWWRAERDPVVAAVVDAISARTAGPVVKDQATWSRLARTRDPLVLGRMLAAVPELPATFLPTAAALLVDFEPDPRVAVAIGHWILEPPTTSSSTYPFWTKVLALAASLGDSRLAPTVARRLAMPHGDSQFWPKFYAALERLRATLAVLPAPGKPAPAIAKLCAAAAKLPEVGALRASGIVAASAKRGPAPTLSGPLLAQAQAHLAANRVGSALDAMVAQWRETRVPALADLIDRASRLLPCWDRPLAASAKEMHAAWEDAFTDPGARLPQLLENLLVGQPKQLELRLIDLANLGDDPRISLRLAQVARACRVSPERTQFWRSVFELLARHRDHRTLAPLLREFEGFAGRYYNHHRQGNRIFGPVAARAELPVYAPGDAQLAAKLETTIATAELAARKTERALLAAIGASPDDDGPRTVYADWLLEQGHPRGELINLALVATPSRGEDARRAELATTPHIFGPLDDVTADDLVLDRGLPTALTIDWNASPLLWRELAAHPLLAIVQSIELEDTSGAELQPSPDQLAPVLAAAPHLKKLTNAIPALAASHGFARRGKDLVRV